MADFQRHLHEHYESQKLPDERMRAIIEAGRVAAVRRAATRRWLFAAAAVVVIGLGIYSGVRAWRGGRPGGPGMIAPADVAAAVANYFSRPEYQLARVSADPADLARWLRENGAPASFSVPRALAALPSFGCQVHDVNGQRVYLICFFLDVSAAEVAAGGMVKKEMVVTAPDGTMMKKNRPLVHFVVAPRAAFRETPKPGTRVAL